MAEAEGGVVDDVGPENAEGDTGDGADLPTEEDDTGIVRDGEELAEGKEGGEDAVEEGAAVGSISHILKTSFRVLYESEDAAGVHVPLADVGDHGMVEAKIPSPPPYMRREDAKPEEATAPDGADGSGDRTMGSGVVGFATQQAAPGATAGATATATATATAPTMGKSGTRKKTLSESKAGKTSLQKKTRRGATKQDDKASNEQLELEEIVLNSMNHKLGYLRNPRYDASNRNHGRMLTFAHGRRVPAETTALQHPHFVADPAEIEFTEYQIGAVYSAPITFRNITAVSRTLRVLPPSGEHFSMGEMIFPSDGAAVAPGMGVKSSIIFTPDSMADFEDHITILTEGGDLRVKVVAHREPPRLTLPTIVRLGSCLIGDAMHVEVQCENRGGPGRFRLLQPADYPEPSQHPRNVPKLFLNDGTFTVTPTQLDLPTNGSATIHVDFLPQETGAHVAEFVMLCDNAQVRRFQLRARCEEVSLQPCAVNGTTVEPEHADQVRLCRFSPVCLGTDTTQTMCIANDGTNEVAFRWILLSPDQVHKHDVQPARPLPAALLDTLASTTTSGGGDVSMHDGGDNLTDNNNINDHNVDNSIVEGTAVAGETTAASASGLEDTAAVLDVEVSPFMSLDGFHLGSNSSGSIGGESARDFTFRFAPQRVGSARVVACLVLDGVPECALPSKRQRDLLEALRQEGHECLRGLDDDALNEIEDQVVYIQQRARKHVVCAMVELLGTGKEVSIDVHPPIASLAGQAPIGVEQTVSFVIKNDFPVFAECEIGTPELLQVPEQAMFHDQLPSAATIEHDVVAGGGGSSAASENHAAAGPLSPNAERGATGDVTEVTPPQGLAPSDARACELQMDEAHVVVPPCATKECTATFTGFFAGHYLLRVPVYTVTGGHDNEGYTDGAGQVATLDTPARCPAATVLVQAAVYPPRLRFDESEVNMGLVGVGYSEKQVVSFTNESSVPVKWLFEQITDSQRGGAALSGMGLPAGKASQSATGNETPSSEASTPDGRSSFTISRPHAKVAFEPVSGVTAPGESGTVTVVCEAGNMPQRVRSTLKCTPADETGRCYMDPQFLSIRAEIQAPAVILRQTMVAYDKIYVGVPVVRYIDLQNLSNLETKFKFERPGGPPKAYTLDIEPRKGVLQAKETRRVKLTMTATQIGRVDDVFGCNVFGMPKPIGFRLSAICRGVEVDVLQLEEGDAVPEPLGAPTDVQYAGEGDPPVPCKPQPLVFGSEVALFQRVTRHIVLRNLSAIPCHFRIRAKKFSSAVHTIEDKASAAARKARAMRLLDDKHEELELFQSLAGKEHVAKRVKAEEDARVLANGKGAAYNVSISEGTLPSWGVVAVDVTSFNNMPGSYNDELACDIAGYKVLHVPLRMGVSGCPVQVDVSSIGVTRPKRGSLTEDKDVMVDLGATPLGAPIPTRKFKLQNWGPLPATVHWDIRDAAAEDSSQMLKITLEKPERVEEEMGDDNVEEGADADAEDGSSQSSKGSVGSGMSGSVSESDTSSDGEDRSDDGRRRRGRRSKRRRPDLVKFRIQFREDLIVIPPFEVTPRSAVLPPQGETEFVACLTDTLTQQDIEGVLVATVAWGDGEVHGSSNTLTPAVSTSSLGAAAESVHDDDGGSSLASSRMGTARTSGTRSATSLHGGANGRTELALGVRAAVIQPYLRVQSKFSSALGIKEQMKGTASLLSGHIAEVLEERRGEGAGVASVKFQLNVHDVTAHASRIRPLSRRVVLVNPTEATLSFSTWSEGAFSILSAHSSGAPHPLANMPPPPGGADASSSASRNDPERHWATNTLSMHPTCAGLFMLPPGESVALDVAYQPNMRQLRDTLRARAGPIPSTTRVIRPEQNVTSYTDEGQLYIGFSSGQEQGLHLQATIDRPGVVVAPPLRDFGVCHVELSCTATLTLSNPTNVFAKWSVEHIPGEDQREQQATTIHVPGYEKEPCEDDVEVFVFHPWSGGLSGPTREPSTIAARLPDDKNHLPDGEAVFNQSTTAVSWKGDTTLRDSLARQNEEHCSPPFPLQVTFKPKRNVRYRSRFRIATEYGEAYDVLLFGHGTYDENDHAPIETKL